MTRSIAIVAFTVLFHLTVPAQKQAARLSDMHWLAGCWESRDDAKKVFLSEQWMKPAGGLMLGVGRTVEREKAVDFEFMRIEQSGVDLIYIARPRANKEETGFKLIRSGPTEATFENAAHDFPQRVIYRRVGLKLFARIEGNKNGKVFGIDYPMTKTKCE